jgi:hypothetical protein
VYLDERSLVPQQATWTPARVYHVTLIIETRFPELKLHIQFGKRGKLSARNELGKCMDEVLIPTERERERKYLFTAKILDFVYFHSVHQQ